MRGVECLPSLLHRTNPHHQPFSRLREKGVNSSFEMEMELILSFVRVARGFRGGTEFPFLLKRQHPTRIGGQRAGRVGADADFDGIREWLQGGGVFPAWC